MTKEAAEEIQLLREEWDWEKFRREAAKDILVGIASSGLGVRINQDVAYSVELADELIKQLKEEKALADLEKQKEQKPIKWSENDKQWLSEVYFAIDHSMYSEDERQAMKKYIDFLRSQSKPAEWSDEDKEQKEIFDADKFFAGKDVNDFKKELFLVIRGAREFKPTDEEIWQNIESQIAPCLVDILQEGVESAEPKRKFKIGDKIKFSSEPKYPAREIVEIKDSAYYFDSAVRLPFTKQDEWELVEEKPAGWSDEDESNATFILESLDGLLRYCKKNKEGAQQSKQIKEAQEWIKTRLKSIEPQPETNDEEYIRNLENLESVVYYAKSLPDDTRTKLGNFLRSLRTRKTCDVDEFSLTLKNCLSADSELTDEQADTFARAYGEDLYKVALGEISTGLDKWDIEEYRDEIKFYPNTQA